MKRRRREEKEGIVKIVSRVRNDEVYGKGRIMMNIGG